MPAFGELFLIHQFFQILMKRFFSSNGVGDWLGTDTMTDDGAHDMKVFSLVNHMIKALYLIGIKSDPNQKYL